MNATRVLDPTELFKKFQYLNFAFNNNILDLSKQICKLEKKKIYWFMAQKVPSFTLGFTRK